MNTKAFDALRIDVYVGARYKTRAACVLPRVWPAGVVGGARVAWLEVPAGLERVAMSLNKLGKTSTARPPSHADHSGIPGSPRYPLFYQSSRQLPIVSHAEGIYLWDTDGKRYLDGCSGACAASIGHRHPRVIARAQEQLQKVAFAYRTQFSSEPANELAGLLACLSPPELNRVFLVNSGSEAVEAAIKLARQYWWAKGKSGKHTFIARRPSYHGATLGALSCTDYAPLNTPFRPLMLPFLRIGAPFCYHCPLSKKYPSCRVACADELETVIKIHGSENIAAFITEPIGGASTGAAVPPDQWFPRIEKICHDNQILLIVDDVLTGCGRTGTFYGYEHWDVTPDIVAVSKGMSGGYAPIGACIASEDIVATVIESGGFMHGHTYAGNPLCAAIASEVIKVIIEEDLVQNARQMGAYLHEHLRALKQRYPIIGDVRGRGLLAGIEFVSDRRNRLPFPAKWWVAQEATQIANEKGLLVYPRRSVFGLHGDHILIAPPLTIDRVGIDELLSLLDATLVELSEMLERWMNLEEAVVLDGTFDRSRATRPLSWPPLADAAEHPEVNVTQTMVGFEVKQPTDDEPEELGEELDDEWAP